ASEKNVELNIFRRSGTYLICSPRSSWRNRARCGRGKSARLPGAVSAGQSRVKTPEALSGGLLPALPTLSRRLWPSRPAHGRFRPCLQARYARPATAAIRREAPGAQATSPVPASGADHEKHDRTSPNTHGPPSSDRSRLSRALPCLEGVAQDLEVPTATRS